jgi:hypothetical protein
VTADNEELEARLEETYQASIEQKKMIERCVVMMITVPDPDLRWTFFGSKVHKDHCSLMLLTLQSTKCGAGP